MTIAQSYTATRTLEGATVLSELFLNTPAVRECQSVIEEGERALNRGETPDWQGILDALIYLQTVSETR